MNKYPLLRNSGHIGALLGIFAGILTGEWLVGYAVLTLCVTIGLTWRRDEAPVFPFILALQWLQVTSGYLFYVITGVIPTFYEAGDIDRTVMIALTGLLVLAAGIRVGASIPEREPNEEPMYVRNLTGLFWLVMLLYGINYVSLLNTKVFGGFDVTLERVLLMRQIPLLLLWFEVFRQQRHRMYLWITLAWVFVPALASYFSDFKTPLLLALIVSASTWRPWENRFWRFTIAGTARTVAMLTAVLFLAMTWQAGVKRDTRKAYDSFAVGSNPIERIELFLSSAATAVPVVFKDTQFVVEGLISRVWYVVFFSRVLEYVPALEPHSDGELLQMAITNTVVPRILFSDKLVLPSDSYYTRRFTGINVADGNTSISIGYMAEFYADWGLFGMFVSVFIYGGLMGGAAWLVHTLVRPRVLVNPALITVLLVASFFENQFIKTLASLAVGLIVTVGVIWVCRRHFERFVGLSPVPETADETDDTAVGLAGRRLTRRRRGPVAVAARNPAS
jgi:hypothetical protein